MAGACPQPQITDKRDRPCFICKKKGCRAATCPQRKVRQPVKALEDVRRDAAGRVLSVEFASPARSPVLAVGYRPVPDAEGFVRPRRPVAMQLGHFLEVPDPTAKTKTNKHGSRYRALQAGDLCSDGW